MTEKIERQKYRIADLRYRLEVLEVERARANMEHWDAVHGTVEGARSVLQDFVFEVRRRELEDRLRAAELGLARLTIKAEWKRLKNLQPSPTVEQLREYRKQFDEVLARHRESAEQQIAAATDTDLTNDRYNGHKPMPERPRRKPQVEAPRQEQRRPRLAYDGPEHEYDGPEMGR